MQGTERVKDPGKQRKMLFNAPAHIRHKHMSAPLSPELSASKGGKTLPVRRGDTIRIKRGDSKGFEGKVSRVDLKAYRIYVEGLTREKVDGTNIFLPIHPSKVEIRSLNLDDKWRKGILERKQAVEKPKRVEKQKAKPVKKTKEELAKIKKQQKEEEEIEAIFEEETPTELAEETAKEAELVAEEEAAPKKVPTRKPAAKKSAAAKKQEAQAAEETKKEKSAKRRSKPKASKKTKGEQ